MSDLQPPEDEFVEQTLEAQRQEHRAPADMVYPKLWGDRAADAKVVETGDFL